ncbi:MAG: MFS transporter [Sneathiellaceae bacterium]
MTTDARGPSLADAMAGGGWLRAALLCAGVWLHAADSLLVATMMPTAIADIGGLPYLSWTVALYVLGSILAGAATGLVSLRLGLRNAMALAALVYALGCLLSAAAPDMATMLAGRLLQGLGGGLMVALSHVGVTRLFPAPLWPQLLALVARVWGASALVGPLVGGLFAEAGLWRGGFLAFAGQALLLAVAIPLVLRNEAPEAGQAEPMPWRRLAVLSAGLLAILWAGVRVDPLQAVPLVAAGIALLLLAFRMDGRAGQDGRPACGRAGAGRLFPRAPLHPRRVWGQGYAMILTLSAASIAYIVYGPLLMERLYGTGPLLAGFMVALEALAWTATAILFANAAARWERLLIRGGAVAITLSLLGFALTVPDGPLWVLAPWALLAGGGFGACWGFVIRRVVESLPPAERERASAAAPTMQILGYAIGAAFCGMVANMNGLDSGTVTLDAARKVGFWVFAAFLPVALLGLAAAWRLSADPPQPAAATPRSAGA